MKRVACIAAGILLFSLSAFAVDAPKDAPVTNSDGVKWNAEYNDGNKSVRVVIDTTGLEKTSHISNVRLRLLIDGGQAKTQLTIQQKEIKAGMVVHEVISVSKGKMHALTPDMLFYKVTAEGGAPDPKPHQQAPTAELSAK